MAESCKIPGYAVFRLTTHCTICVRARSEKVRNGAAARCHLLLCSSASRLDVDVDVLSADVPRGSCRHEQRYRLQLDSPVPSSSATMHL